MQFFLQPLALRVFVLLGIFVASASSYAKTFTYEVKDLMSHNGTISYPGLDFNAASSAVLTVYQASAETEPQIETLKLSFPNATTLVVRDFKKVDGMIHRAVVDDAWIYRQLIVNVHGSDLNPYNNNQFHIEVKVSEKAGFINTAGEERGETVLMAFGMLQDITPAKVADVASAIVDGKRVNLSLSSKLGVPVTGGEGGFIIDANWFGKGQKKLYVNSGFPQQHFGFIEPIRLVIEEVDLPDGKDQLITLFAKDPMGGEIAAPSVRLRELLDQAYGPQPW